MTLTQYEGLYVALSDFLATAISHAETESENPEWLLSEESAEMDLFFYGLHIRGFHGFYTLCEFMSRRRVSAAQQRNGRVT